MNKETQKQIADVRQSIALITDQVVSASVSSREFWRGMELVTDLIEALANDKDN